MPLRALALVVLLTDMEEDIKSVFHCQSHLFCSENPVSYAASLKDLKIYQSVKIFS